MAGAVLIPGWRDAGAARVEGTEEETVIVEGEGVECIDGVLRGVEVIQGGLYCASVSSRC